MDDFTRAYIEAALWSSPDEENKFLSENYSEDDIAPETLETIKADCERFQAENAEHIQYENCSRRGLDDYTVDERAGHDFWLTRNGHGAGFWDGDWSEPAATILTDASQKFGQVDLYIGDDGKIYA